MSDFVWVPRGALEAFIDYAQTMKGMADQEFVCSRDEQHESDAEFAELVAALGLDA